MYRTYILTLNLGVNNYLLVQLFFCFFFSMRKLNRSCPLCSERKNTALSIRQVFPRASWVNAPSFPPSFPPSRATIVSEPCLHLLQEKCRAPPNEAFCWLANGVFMNSEPQPMATATKMLAVIDRIKRRAISVYVSPTFAPSSSVRISNTRRTMVSSSIELMSQRLTVKRAHTLYINLIIFAWQRKNVCVCVSVQGQREQRVRCFHWAPSIKVRVEAMFSRPSRSFSAQHKSTVLF